MQAIGTSSRTTGSRGTAASSCWRSRPARAKAQMAIEDRHLNGVNLVHGGADLHPGRPGVRGRLQLARHRGRRDQRQHLVRQGGANRARCSPRPRKSPAIPSWPPTRSRSPTTPVRLVASSRAWCTARKYQIGQPAQEQRLIGHDERSHDRGRLPQIHTALLDWCPSTRTCLAQNQRSVRNLGLGEIMLQQTQVRNGRALLRAIPGATFRPSRAGPRSTRYGPQVVGGPGLLLRARNSAPAAAGILAAIAAADFPRPRGIAHAAGHRPLHRRRDRQQRIRCAAPMWTATSAAVLCRVFRIRGNPKDVAVQKRTLVHRRELVPERKPGLFNQA